MIFKFHDIFFKTRQLISECNRFVDSDVGFKNKCSDRSMEVSLHVLLGNYARPRSTDEPTDIRGHREVTLPTKRNCNSRECTSGSPATFNSCLWNQNKCNADAELSVQSNPDSNFCENFLA